MEEFRTLLYPLGLFSSLFFGLRFIVQWIESEQKGFSYVPRSFWILSLFGNVFLGIHSFLQIQFHVCLAQVSNGVIGWRNLNLFKPESKRVSLKTTFLIMCFALLGTIVIFMIQDYVFAREGHWFRVPQAPWKDIPNDDVPFSWHLLGFFSYLLFSSRFWVQWWYAEKQMKSDLPPLFWWISLVGTALTLLYFWRINDLVNIVGPSIGLIPYLRNLMFFYRTKEMTIQND